MRRILILLMLLMLPIYGANYALLIGISHYKNPQIPTLFGPANDLEQMRKILIKHWDFPPSHIIILKDSSATKENILSSLHRLIQQASSSDLIFLYYSGHGTSLYDPNLGTQLGLSPLTGATVPYDFNLIKDPTGTISAFTLQSLIIGKRDLKPLILKGEKKGIRFFAAFDSCYSGYAIRGASFSRRFPVRSIGRLPVDFSLPQTISWTATPTSKYPYKKTIYISASKEDEPAVDIPPQFASQGWTFDQKPHGAFTNSLLLALQGLADINMDGKITYQELYQYLSSELPAKFGQSPNLLYPPGEETFRSNGGVETLEERPVGAKRFFHSDRLLDRLPNLRIRIRIRTAR